MALVVGCAPPAVDVTSTSSFPPNQGTNTFAPPPTSTTTTTAGTTSSTAAGTGQLPDHLLAHSGGIVEVGSGVTWLTGAAVRVALPDQRGGVLFQLDTEYPYGAIQLLAAPGSDPAVVVAPPRGGGLTLLDVFDHDGSPSMLFTVSTRLPNDCASDDVECLWQYDVVYLVIRDLDSGTSVNLGTVGGFESERNDFRIAGDTYVSVWGAYGGPGGCVGYGDLEVVLSGASPERWLDARKLCVLGPPVDECKGPFCVESLQGQPSPDGTRLVYAAGDHQTHLSITVVDTASGDVLATYDTDEAASSTWLAYDGSWIVVGRADASGIDIAPVVVRPDGVVEELEFTGRVAFLER